MSGIAFKGRRIDRDTRMVAGHSPERLQWMMDNGLAWRGSKPENWKPTPASFRAWLFYLFVMIPRSL